uniref:Uncharacterized protein n=1 Tax=Daphnia pulex TaxID=6669 RepID=E9G2D5_DAPPU|nr:hypothetical protein DAPPUDRAFT_236961 [Daphnia pulex]|eukprot:EFX86328.1 hypothetical protein DAPPUDRAFT_236961 [Daphnia pulex]
MFQAVRSRIASQQLTFPVLPAHGSQFEYSGICQRQADGDVIIGHGRLQSGTLFRNSKSRYTPTPQHRSDINTSKPLHEAPNITARTRIKSKVGLKCKYATEELQYQRGQQPRRLPYQQDETESGEEICPKKKCKVGTTSRNEYRLIQFEFSGIVPENGFVSGVYKTSLSPPQRVEKERRKTSPTTTTTAEYYKYASRRRHIPACSVQYSIQSSIKVPLGENRGPSHQGDCCAIEMRSDSLRFSPDLLILYAGAHRQGACTWARDRPSVKRPLSPSLLPFNARLSSGDIFIPVLSVGFEQPASRRHFEHTLASGENVGLIAEPARMESCGEKTSRASRKSLPNT